MTKILLIATGGTISCDSSSQGMRPAILAEQLVGYITLDGVTLDGLQLMNVDSAEMRPEDWLLTAQAIGARYNDYDGFVVIHGTDTMAYAGAFLAKAMTNLTKPVAITGAQVPLSLPNSDGVKNLNDAVAVVMDAAAQGAGGIFGVFGGKILDGSRMRKIDSSHHEAFVCSAGRSLGVVTDGAAKWHRELEQPPQDGSMQVTDAICTQVAVLRVFPALKGAQVRAFAAGLKGLVVEAFGIGAVPPDAAKALVELAADGLQVVIVSQIMGASTNLTQYEITRGLVQAANIREGGRYVGGAGFCDVGY